VKAFSCVTGFYPAGRMVRLGTRIPRRKEALMEAHTSTVVHVGGFGLIVVGIFDTELFGSFEALFSLPRCGDDYIDFTTG